MAQPKTTLFVVRHGETVWNLQQRFQGSGDSPLTDKGRSDARALGKRLKDVPIDVLISSDLGRAMETASIITEFTGHEIRTDPRLRERHYGVLEGLTLAEIEARHADTYQILVDGNPDEVIPQGESHRHIYDRNISFFQEFLRDHAGATALLIVHGGVLDSILRMVLGLALDHPRSFATVNAALNKISHGQYYRNVQWVVETWGDVAHLTD